MLFNDIKGPKKCTIKFLFESFQWTENVYDDRVGNVGQLHRRMLSYSATDSTKTLVSVRHVQLRLNYDTHPYTYHAPLPPPVSIQESAPPTV